MKGRPSRDVTGGDLAERARRLGPLPFSALPAAPAPALPPSDELAGWMVSTIDELWHLEGRPDPFTFVEVGAADGSHVRDLLGAGPECLTTLRVVLVEGDAGRRAAQAATLAVEAPAFVLGPSKPDPDDGPAEDDEDAGTGPVTGVGPLVTSLAEIPVLEGSGAIIAVGTLGCLPADRYELLDGRWHEVRLAARDGAGEDLEEILVPLDVERAAVAERAFGGSPVPGRRYALQGGAAAWLSGALRCAERGWLVVLDRWSETAVPVPPGQQPPLALDQLSAVRRPGKGVEPGPASLSHVRWRLG